MISWGGMLHRIHETQLSPEEINERIAKLTREDIISCAKTFKPDTVFVIRGEEEEDCDE